MATQTLAASTGSVFAPRHSQSAPAAAKPQERIRLYKDFLTPALHRRFTSAAGIVLAACWLEAVLIGDRTHLFWSWFPISITGLRTLLLFAPCLSVFICRVANIHVGERNANSPAAAFIAHVVSAKSIGSTAHTLGWYMWSGWFFGEVYIWTGRPEDNLGWIDPGRPYERARLNENPVFLRCLLTLLGLIQGIRHLAADYDRVVIPTRNEIVGQQETADAASKTDKPVSPLAKLPEPLRRLFDRSGEIFNRAFKLTALGFPLVGLPVYFIFLRRTAWPIAYTIGRTFFGQLPPSAPPSGFLNFGTLAWQSISSSLLLSLLWEVSNAAFDVFVALPPLKKEQPLTNEIKDGRGVLLHKSKDPNGSLLTGLKSKKEVPRSFAFWELSLICAQFESRRKTIFTEVDRAGGSTWRQVCDACLGEISKVTQRIKSVDNHGRAIAPPPKPAPVDDATLGLPKIANQSVRDDTNIVVKPKQDFTQSVGDLAKSIGQSPTGRDPLAALQRGAEQLVPKDERQRFINDQFAHANSRAIKILQTPVGESFRKTFARRAATVVFGAPYGNKSNVIHAARAISKLATSSLLEAQYGGVSKDIPSIVRVFTDAVLAIEKFLQSLEPDWTDVYFTGRDREVREIQEVVEVLKEGLEAIVLAFGEYAGELGLSKKEVREAREASTRKAVEAPSEKKALPAARERAPEMAQVRRR